MIPIQITFDLDRNPWTDLRDAEIDFGNVTRIGLLRHGTVEGNATVALVVTLEDGRQIGAQTTWALLRTVYGALNASPIVAEEVIGP